MNYDLLEKIRAQVELYTRKRTSNILEGGFRSIFRGRSLDFDELREYVPGDNVKDIDWKSSSKAGRTLVRKYVAERKHNVLLSCDAGRKMDAHTPAGCVKADLAVQIMGTIAYLSEGSGADYALMHSGRAGYEYTFFRSGPTHLENLMRAYSADVCVEPRNDIREILNYAVDNILRKMIIFIITDLDGLSRMDEELIEKMTVNNDAMVVNIDDVYLTGDTIYDISSGSYEDDFVLQNRALAEAEREARGEILRYARANFRRYGVSMVTIENEEEIVDKIVDLFRRHRDEDFG